MKRGPYAPALPPEGGGETAPLAAAASSMLAQAWVKMSEEERAHVARMHDHYVREFDNVREARNQEGLALGTASLVDDAIEHTKATQPGNALRVRCAKGCAHCCRINVTITRAEARLLLMSAAETGVDIEWPRVVRQSFARGLRGWSGLPVADRECVFLGAAGECRVYDERPVACRKHFAVTEPELCDTVAHPGGKVGHFVSIEAEVVASAALVALPSGPMPLMLLAARAEREGSG